MERKGIDELEVNDIIKAGLCIDNAKEFHKILKETIGAAKGQTLESCGKSWWLKEC
jgi:hypothetical protein